MEAWLEVRGTNRGFQLTNQPWCECCGEDSRTKRTVTVFLCFSYLEIEISELTMRLHKTAFHHRITFRRPENAFEVVALVFSSPCGALITAYTTYPSLTMDTQVSLPLTNEISRIDTDSTIGIVQKCTQTIHMDSQSKQMQMSCLV
ncbi:hypothetical protein TcWFU_006336 [Taenia crassiceps]|uniref:Uncharacterized protein n=1 Tax=Taenia crassiceps TaxID=6207 RepID=A0ABR4QLU3_9CEST